MWRTALRRTDTHALPTATAAAAVAFFAASAPKANSEVPGPGGNGPSASERFYTPKEVSERDGITRPELWVSYGGSVYDVSSFAAEHPGGESMLRDAAGGPMEPFWGYWAYHRDSPKAPVWLPRYRIGTLVVDENEGSVESDREDVENELYAEEPRKGTMQIPLSQRPWCSETDPRALRSHFTANDDFYIRNHAPVPVLDAEDHDVGFECDEDAKATVIAMKNVNVNDLRNNFEMVTVHSTLQCAGNRGSEMIAIAPTAFTGTPYEVIRTGLMGNAAWSGVRLRDVLLRAFPEIGRFDEADVDSHHVEFEGADGYLTSSPLRNIIEKESDALLAFEMNGEPLPPDHGYPVRAFLPGHAGARNVKWLHRIRLKRKESESCWSTLYYKGPDGGSIQRMPLQSFMLSKQLSGRHIRVKGVAWGGGEGKGVSKVEVSANEGKSWVEAHVSPRPHDGQDASKGKWSWVHFEANVPLKGESLGSLPAVYCRAYDGEGKTQPEKMWYPKGYLYNGWHQL